MIRVSALQGHPNQSRILRESYNPPEGSWKAHRHVAPGRLAKGRRGPCRCDGGDASTYGSQFAAFRSVLRAVPRRIWEDIRLWLVSPAGIFRGKGLVQCTSTRDKGLVLELMWMTLLRADRHIPSGAGRASADPCLACLPLAARLHTAGTLEQRGARRSPTCAASYTQGALASERCNVSHFVDGLSCDSPHLHCEMTVTDSPDADDRLSKNGEVPERWPPRGTHVAHANDVPVRWLSQGEANALRV